MKDKYNNDKDHNHSKHTQLEKLDQLAREIDSISRNFLRDGVLAGLLRGYEDEIRQSAIHLILGWVVRGEQECQETGVSANETAKGSWNLPAIVARALRICKMRMARHLTKEVQGRETLSEINGGTCQHESDLTTCDWTDPVRREMAIRGLRLAVKSGKLSQTNACVAILILEGCMTVDEVARHLHVSTGAIYQQLRRVKKILPSVVETLEHPFL